MGKKLYGEQMDSTENPDTAAFESLETARSVRRAKFILTLLIMAFLVGSYMWLSSYDPIHLEVGSFEAMGANQAHRAVVAAEWDLQSSGPFPVEVVSLSPRLVANPPVRVQYTEPCLYRYKNGYYCPQDKLGFPFGLKFYNFSLGPKYFVPVAVKFSYNCVVPANNSSEVVGPEELLVKYRFLFFTHTEITDLPAINVSTNPLSGPCAK